MLVFTTCELFPPPNHGIVQFGGKITSFEVYFDSSSFLK
jgi:hypothetical protein